MENGDIKRVLIFLLGSLGDTLVALPALRLVARCFPSAERRVLTDRGSHPNAASMEALLDGTALVHAYYWFPASAQGASRLGRMLGLARDIKAWKPEALIYLHEQRGLMIARRDALIFRALGIRQLIGVPVTRALQRRLYDKDRGQFEHRSQYLARSMAHLGDSRLNDRFSWNLALSQAERARAQTELSALQHCPGILAMSIGTKVPANDWGNEKWLALLRDLSKRLPGWGLIALGALMEQERSCTLLNEWQGPKLNLCGQLSVRESAAVIERVRVFIGHDSGPMHLAATVGTPCAAIFSARNLPGTWFPFGEGHAVFYKKTDCAGCGLDVCEEFKMKCITSVSVAEVCAAVVDRTMQVPLYGLAKT